MTDARIHADRHPSTPVVYRDHERSPARMHAGMSKQPARPAVPSANKRTAVQPAANHRGAPLPRSGALHTPERIVQLQKAIGNKSTIQWMRQQASEPFLSPAMMRRPIQRLMAPNAFKQEMAKDEKHEDSQEQQLLWSVLAYLMEYKDVIENKDDMEQSVWFRERLRILNRMDRHIYEWFDQVKQPDLSANPNSALMRRLMKDSEQEHIGIIARLKKEPDGFAPVDTENLSEDEVLEVQQLWTSLAKQDGNVKIKGGEAFHNKILSRLVKLMQGKQGRALVGMLNEKRDEPLEQIRIVENIVGDGDQGSKGSFAKQIEEPLKAKSIWDHLQKRPPVKDRHELQEQIGAVSTDDAESFPVVQTPAEINTAILKGGAQGFTYQNRRYSYSRGQGSWVRIEDDDVSKLDADLNEIVTPGFVTLGHELGHASRMLRGGSLGNSTLWGDWAPSMGLDPDTDSNDKKYWSNMEEYININEMENSIRSEHGLTPRAYHATNVRGIMKRKELQDEYNRILHQVDVVYQPYVQTDAELYEQLFYKEDWDLNDPSVVEDIYRKLNLWEEHIPSIMEDAVHFEETGNRFYAIFKDGVPGTYISKMEKSSKADRHLIEQMQSAWELARAKNIGDPEAVLALERLILSITETVGSDIDLYMQSLAE